MILILIFFKIKPLPSVASCFGPVGCRRHNIRPKASNYKTVRLDIALLAAVAVHAASPTHPPSHPPRAVELANARKIPVEEKKHSRLGVYIYKIPDQ